MPLTQVQAGMMDSTAQYYSFKNRIINGACAIDQRNAGASVTPTNGQYTIDRWCSFLSQSSKYTVQKNAGSVTPPAGFSNYLGVTSSSAYSVLTSDTFFQYQPIEGFNFADMAWGTANAQTVTLSFWVRSSLTGTFGGALTNEAANRSYPFSFTVSSANTWEQKTISIAGDTTGTWVGATNGTGALLRFGLGSGSTYTGTAGAWAAANIVQPTGTVSVVGTNGATFYITGVQLEKGSTATSFDYRPYTTELQLCQRYYEKSFDTDTAPANGGSATSFSTGNGLYVGVATNRQSTGTTIRFAVAKRTTPSFTYYGNSSGQWAYISPSGTSLSWSASVASGQRIGTGGFGNDQQIVDGALIFVLGHWAANAEL